MQTDCPIRKELGLTKELELFYNYYDEDQDAIRNFFECPICQKNIENHGNNSALNRHITNCFKIHS